MEGDVDSSHVASSSSGVGSFFEEHSETVMLERRCNSRNLTAAGDESDERGEYLHSENFTGPIKEGISSPAAHRMKMKDVSQYMNDIAKESPQLAQKLHDVLLESGVVAPPNLFGEIYPEHLDISTLEARSPAEDKEGNEKSKDTQKTKGHDDCNLPRFLPPLPYHGLHSKFSDHSQPKHQLDSRNMTGQPISSQSEVTPPEYVKNVPVAAVAAAAAVATSSMVVAVTKTSADSSLELPIEAAATTAAVDKQHENIVARSHWPSGEDFFTNRVNGTRVD
ncbi:hypothetical protein U1Q18_038077 [Sarracenia purpurea var. burkii]